MGEGREPRAGSGRPPHEELVERIVSADGRASSEAQLRVVVEAMAGRDEVEAAEALHGFLRDTAAKEQLASWLNCSTTHAVFIAGAATTATITELDSPTPDLERVVSALLIWL